MENKVDLREQTTGQSSVDIARARRALFEPTPERYGSPWLPSGTYRSLAVQAIVREEWRAPDALAEYDRKAAARTDYLSVEAQAAWWQAAGTPFLGGL